LGQGLGLWRRVLRRARDERVAGWVAIAVGTAIANVLVMAQETTVRLGFAGGMLVSVALFLATTTDRPWDGTTSRFTRDAGQFMILYGLLIVALAVIVRVIAG
jgi:hypothetical protein